MSMFDNLVNYLLESNTAGAGGVFGDAASMNQGGAVGNKDFYAPGSAIVPKILGIYKRSGKVKTKKKRS